MKIFITSIKRENWNANCDQSSKWLRPIWYFSTRAAERKPETRTKIDPLANYYRYNSETPDIFSP